MKLEQKRRFSAHPTVLKPSQSQPTLDNLDADLENYTVPMNVVRARMIKRKKYIANTAIRFTSAQLSQEPRRTTLVRAIASGVSKPIPKIEDSTQLEKRSVAKLIKKVPCKIKGPVPEKKGLICGIESTPVPEDIKLRREYLKGYRSWQKAESQTFEPDIVLKSPISVQRQVISRREVYNGGKTGITSSGPRSRDRNNLPNNSPSVREFSSFSQKYQNVGQSIENTNASHRKLLIGQFTSRSKKNSKQNSSIRETLAKWQKSTEENEKQALVDLGIPSMMPGFAAKSNADPQEVEEHEEILDLAESNTENEHHLGGRRDIEPGDLIELVLNGSCQLAVVVATFPHQRQLFSESGRWSHNSMTDTCTFSVAKWATNSELEPLLDYLPKKPLPIDLLDSWNGADTNIPYSVSQALLEKMNKFRRDADDQYRKNADKIDNAYKSLAKQRENLFLSLEDISRKVLAINSSDLVPQSTLWAVHRSIILHQEGFLTGPAHWKSKVFDILSRNDMEIVQQVQRWTREYQEYCVENQNDMAATRTAKHRTRPVLFYFIERVKGIVEQNRTFRKLNSEVSELGPSSIECRLPSGDQDFISHRNVMLSPMSPTESLVFRFLELWSCRGGVRRNSSTFSTGCNILKALGLYDQEKVLDFRMGLLLLKECGVLAPWQSVNHFNPRLALPGSGFDPIGDNMLVAAAKSSEKWIMHDTMKEFRRDWGDMEVFVIDSYSTEVYDDGFSIEPSHEPDTFWIHVHIANPTAFMSPDHPMAQYAARLSQNIYLVRQKFPTIPDKVSINHLGLAPHRPVLTFSAKMTMEGELLDSRIQPGIIHNVVYATSETVSQNLAPDLARSVPNLPEYVVGQKISEQTNKENSVLQGSLSPSQVQQLNILHKLAMAFNNRGLDKEAALAKAIAVYSMNSHVVTPRVLHTNIEYPWRRAFRRVEGDPTIILPQGKFNIDYSKGSLDLMATQGLTARIMTIACIVAGRWCAERGIPATYRGTVNCSMTYPEVLKEIGLIRDKFYTTPFAARLQFRNEWMPKMGKSIESQRPLRHDFQGEDAYLQVTSPLRRYNDMVAHWQIEAAIREEAKLRRRFSENDCASLPFSVSKLKEITEYSMQRYLNISIGHHIDRLSWITQLKVRAVHFNECENFPEYLTWHVVYLSEVYALGIFGETSTTGTYNFVPTERTPKVGEIWKVKIVRVSSSRLYTFVRLVEQLPDVPI
jgi:hypothetical protein